jgi:hypothetical protein
MTKRVDTSHQRIELTGPWAGFGFQAGHFWTPEGYTLYPGDMRWWSLTCNIAQEWQRMMAEARGVSEGDSRPAVGEDNVLSFRRGVQARLARVRPALRAAP